MSQTSLKTIVESLLFAADGPLSLERLATLLEEYERPAIKAVLSELQGEYGVAGRGVILAEVAGGWQLRTPPETADFIRRLNRGRVARFSQSALETLAIIAYRQPVTRAEMEYLRGVDCGAVLKTLLDRKLVRILGKKDIPGRPLIYGTTREFLEAFSLKDLASLPSLKEIQELVEPGRDELQAELPLPFDGPGADES